MISQSGRVGRVAGRFAALIAFGLIGAGVQAQAPAAPAKPDPAKGQQIAAAACAACHGADGNSVIAQNPKLNGQHADYIVKQLIDYTKPADAKDARVNPIMLGFASSLSADDRRHVAAWYASQKPTPGAARVKETLGLGQRIYRAGIPEKAILPVLAAIRRTARAFRSSTRAWAASMPSTRRPNSRRSATAPAATTSR